MENINITDDQLLNYLDGIGTEVDRKGLREAINKNPLAVRREAQLNNSTGINPLKSLMPIELKNWTVLSDMDTGLGFARSTPPTSPPMATPPTKNKFQLSFFQS